MPRVKSERRVTKSRPVAIPRPAETQSEETEANRDLLHVLIDLARDLPSNLQSYYFKNTFLMLLHRGQRLVQTDMPDVQDLVAGKCNIPAPVTARSQLYKKPYPCRVVCKSQRYFCHHHAHIALASGLPVFCNTTIPAPVDNNVPSNMAHNSDVKDVHMDANWDQQLDRYVDTELNFAETCHYENHHGVCCTQIATFGNFCDAHQSTSACFDELLDIDENAARQAQYIERCIGKMESVLENVAQSHGVFKGDDAKSHNESTPLVHTPRLYCTFLILKLNVLKRSLGIGILPTHVDMLQHTKTHVPSRLIDHYFTINNDVSFEL